MNCNLLSVTKARRAGFRVMFDVDKDNSGYCEIVHKSTEHVYLKGIERPEGLYGAQFRPDKKENAFVSKEKKQDV